jgi:hypothetical protein
MLSFHRTLAVFESECGTENSVKTVRGNPDKTKPFRWPKGKSGNPGGRPRKVITAAYGALADQPCPFDPQKRTWAQVLAEGQFKAALTGNTNAAREIADRLEGKAQQSVNLEQGNDAIKVILIGAKQGIDHL